MVQIRPFKAIRPEEELVEKIASLPYDVLDSNEARTLGEKNPYSYLHIDKAEIDLPETLSPYDCTVYEQARKNLVAFQKKHWLKKESTPALYLYELTMSGHVQTGVVCCTSIEEYLDGQIKKHEYTRPEKEQDRINHSDVCDANTSPIFLTYRAQDAIDKLICEWKEQFPPIYNFTSFHNVTHRVWLVDQTETIAQLESLFRNVSALYIADGHHRTESAVKVGQKRQAQFPDAQSDAEFNVFLSVLFPKEQLKILDYNRVLNVQIPPRFLQQLEEGFFIKKVEKSEAKPQTKHTFALYFNHQWYQLTAKHKTIQNDLINQLDVTILQKEVFERFFDIQDIRTDKRIDFVGGIRGLDELERLVDSQSFTLAFALFPTTMDDLLNVADHGLIMPPKSTWFEPKLLSGLFVHDFETK